MKILFPVFSGPLHYQGKIIYTVSTSQERRDCYCCFGCSGWQITGCLFQETFSCQFSPNRRKKTPRCASFRIGPPNIIGPPCKTNEERTFNIENVLDILVTAPSDHVEIGTYTARQIKLFRVLPVWALILYPCKVSSRHALFCGGIFVFFFVTQGFVLIMCIMN